MQDTSPPCFQFTWLQRGLGDSKWEGAGWGWGGLGEGAGGLEGKSSVCKSFAWQFHLTGVQSKAERHWQGWGCRARKGPESRLGLYLKVEVGEVAWEADQLERDKMRGAF